MPSRRCAAGSRPASGRRRPRGCPSRCRPELGEMKDVDPLILAVEDEPRNAALLEAILTRAGYRLHIADRVGEARAWLADGTPALVLLDRHLPDGDGLDLIPEIKGTARLRDVPILLVSASVLPQDVEAAMAAGCD